MVAAWARLGRVCALVGGALFVVLGAMRTWGGDIAPSAPAAARAPPPRFVVRDASALQPARHFDVIVIGLGFGGAELAALLARDGKDFVAFEARSTYGGRAQRTDVGGVHVPRGAGWQQGGGPWHPLTERIEACGVRTRRQDWESWEDYLSTGEPARVPYAAWDAAWACVGRLGASLLSADAPDLSLRAALRLCGWYASTEEEWLVQSAEVDFEYAESATATGLLYNAPQSTYEPPHTEEDRLIVDGRGSEELVGCWLDMHLTAQPDGPGPGRASARLSYTSPVDHVDTERRTLTLRNGSTYSYAALFDTRSLAVHQWNAAKEGGDAFSPRLGGARLAALASLSYPLYMKVYFLFDRRFWGAEQFAHVMSASGRGGAVWQAVGRLLPHERGRTGAPLLCATVVSPVSDRLEAMSDDAVADTLLRDLRAVFGRRAVRAPLHVRVARWRSNEWFRGTYLNGAPSTDGFEREAELSRPFGANGSALWVGEHSCDRLGGYMHGSVLAAQTAYDEFKLRRGEQPLVRAEPRDNLCYVQHPTDPLGDVGLARTRGAERTGAESAARQLREVYASAQREDGGAHAMPAVRSRMPHQRGAAHVGVLRYMRRRRVGGLPAAHAAAP